MARRVLLIAVFVFFASTSAPAQPMQDAGSTRDATRALYRRDCAVCHGANGNGMSDLVKDEQLTVSDWTDPKSLSAKSDQQLFSIIRFGKNRMPSESAGRANNDQVNSLIQYIRSFAKAQPIPVSAAPPATKP